MRTFLITGLTGTGKSSFINSVVGAKVAATDRFRSCTKISNTYRYNSPAGDISLIDTPGLREDTEKLDRIYLRNIKKAVQEEKISATLYTARVTETRLTRDELRGISLITEELGREIWQTAWLVLTFCASIPTHQLEDTCHARLRHVVQALDECGVTNGFRRILLCDNVESNWSYVSSVHLNRWRNGDKPYIYSIDAALDRDEIAKRAYSLWEMRGRNGGSADEDWFQARGEIWSRRLAAL